MKKPLLIITALFSVIILCAGTVSAVTTGTDSSGQALEISPPVITLSVDPGKTVTTQINIRDISPTKLVVTGQINDFVAAGEDGTPKLLIDEKDQIEDNPYSMKTWIAPINSLTLNPKEIKKLPITINVPANAAPGGYYATVRFTASAPGIDSSGVALSASLGSLLLVKVNGDVKEDMSTVEVGASLTPGGKNNLLFESAPIYFFERIKNSGNIHEQPTGQMTVTDMFGKKVAVVNINLPPKSILPNSIRRFEQTFDKSVIGKKMLFGKYTVNMKMVYGSDSKVLSSSFSFWVIPYRLIGIAIIIIVSGFFALRFGLKRYNAHIIKQAHRSRRR
jgi:hypothetical protein